MPKPPSQPIVMAAAAEQARKETGFATSYAEFAKTLRTWFVAYGIGAPVLVLNQESVRNALAALPNTRQLTWCFLGGVTLQIFAALTYKVAMWYLYMGELDSEFCETRRYRVSEWISTAFWLELCFDLGAIALFGFATVRIVTTFTS